jgi:hypothetical protein
LLLFANPQDDAELLKYLSYVANTSALARRLQVVVFYSSQYRGMPGALVDSSSLPFPAIDVDANGRQLQDSLGVRHTLRKAILTDEHLNVRFAANFFKKNDARALLGRYVGQEWSRYPAEAKRIPLGVGDPMIDTGVKNLRSGEILPDLPPDIRTWIVLTARCTSCTLANTLTELDTATLPSTEWTHMGLLFSRYFPETAILPRLSALHVRVPAFIATSELQGPEDPYWQRSLGPDSEITVQVRDDHVISGIGRFESLIRPPSH